jgi:hypothetical protein
MLHTGDPDRLNHDLDRYLSIQAGDIERATQTYLEYGACQTRGAAKTKPAASAIDYRPHRSAAATVEPSFTPPTHQRQRLANGMEVVVVERRGCRPSLWVSFCEQDQPSIPGACRPLSADRSDALRRDNDTLQRADRR